jgi:hypothetical protein
MTIARQRLGKNIPEVTLSTIRDKNEKCFLCGPRREYLLGKCVVTRLYNNRGAVFSVLHGPCRDFIRVREWELSQKEIATGS